MRGPKDFAVAVRRADGEIVTTKEDVESVLGKFKWLNKPFLRGTLALIDSMALGIKALKYAADIAMQDAAQCRCTSADPEDADPGEPQEAPDGERYDSQRHNGGGVDPGSGAVYDGADSDREAA